MAFATSCGKNAEENESVVKEHNLNEAASFNTRLGLAYLKQGDRPRAKRKLLIALEQAPDSPNVNAAMAYFLEKTGVLDKAQVYYQKAMSLAPNNGAQLNNYGAFLCRQGQYKQAENYFLRAVKDVQYENTAAAYENAGLCALAIPDTAKAAFYFNKALEQDPSRKQSLYELVKLEANRNHLNEALNLLRQYPALSLRDSRLLSLAADIAHRAGDKDLEANYRSYLQRLSNFSENTGVKDEHSNDLG
ncbi:type IV pilus biogenesis/stability protein PilW [Legionella londiniensis]|uniref:type IV pilus biogenesis/stability protein PilW n=1 Tax=Legionella londiniensis TaxID=45068 RepID=UPI0023552139|nr:type IV pilus biogenesis/stability protein PilW [Legionella londiniensis]